MENDKCKILWNFTIQTDHIIQARRPDIVLVNKQERTCQLIDVACPADRKVVEKEEEKIEKYRDLAREVAKLWNVRVKIIPVVIRDNPKWFGGKDKWDGNIFENCTDSDVGITWDGENSEKSSWNLRLLDATWCSS